ncbi:hypothetical protein CC79DRAFT_1360260 [Sarocladium strictum]
MQKLQLFSTTAGQTSLQPALGQACDQCRRRKSRCNRACPCVHCLKTGQACSYDQAPRTRGRKPRRRNTGDEIVSRPEEDPGEVAFWQQDLPDLTCDNIPLSLAMDDQQLPPTPISTLDWRDPCIISTPIISPDLVKTGNLNNGSWLSAIAPPQLLDRSCFIPYVQQFFDRLYAVFPVVERDQLLDIVTNPHMHGQPLPPSIYTFLTALSAAVTVQLNLSDEDTFGAAGSVPIISEEGPVASPSLSPDLLIAQCLETRRNEGFIENADEWTILTSFFLFAYYGNCDQPRSAWYYLREAIGFAQSLGLDDPDMYVMLDPKTAQRRRLLFWLLFVTERAYALQHRSRVVLQNTIPLPHVFESPEPQLMYGFVTLARVFSSVDHSFITAWRNQQTPLLARVSGDTRQVLSRLLREDVGVDVVEMNETQRLDVLVTQQWLKTLAWRLKCSVDTCSQMSLPEVGSGCQKTCRESSCIITASKNLLHIVNTASSPSLEAHGIGMEQKVSDVANCLCEVLETSDEPEVALDFFSTQDFLHQFMVFLADFRRRESQYLQPLLERATRSLSCCVEPQRPLLLDSTGEEDWMCKSLAEEQVEQIAS